MDRYSRMVGSRGVESVEFLEDENETEDDGVAIMNLCPFSAGL